MTTLVKFDDRLIEEEKLRTATIGDMIEAGWDNDSLNLVCVDEENDLWKDRYDENVMPYEDIIDIDVDDYFAISYWDGNNWRTDVFEDINRLRLEGEVSLNDEKTPNPAFSFIYDIKIDNEVIETVKSNMSGSLSPYYFIED